MKPSQPKDPNSALKFDHDVLPIIFEEDPTNPFGKNYTKLSEDRKLVFKYKMMKTYIKFSREDDEKLILEYLKLGGEIAFPSAVIGSTCVVVDLVRNWKNQTIQRFKRSLLVFYVPFMIFSFMGYQQKWPSFCRRVYDPLMQKYMQKAVKNGFVDYDISKK